MDKKHLLCLISISLVSLTNISAQTSEQTKPTLNWYGFVNNQMYFDDRESLQGAADLFNIIPLDIKKDMNGNDLNDRSTISMLAITTRLGARLAGPDLFGAKTSGQFEADFTGFSGSTTMLSIRQANFKFDWGHDALTLGQTWHPMSGEIFPETIGIAMGAPFNPFNRSPQIRYDRYLLQKQLRLSIAAIYQFQYASTGINGRSYEYQKNALAPEVYLGADFTLGDFKFGIGGEFQRIAPRTIAYENAPKVEKTYEYMNSLCGMFQASYNKGGLSLKTKTVWGENMSHLGITSGYGVYGLRDDLVGYMWNPLSAISSWIMGTYSVNNLKSGLFLGYMKNLGSDEYLFSPTTMYVFGGNNIDEMYRISPNITYTVGCFDVGLEYERTSVAYGTVKSNGTVRDTHWVTNNRVLVSTTYKF